MCKLSKFIQRAKKVHSSKYDYSLVEYIDNRTKVKIICKYHGIFTQIPFIHTGKQQSGCNKCSIDSQTRTNDDFISDAIKIHGDKYDYSKVNYINNRTKVKIICNNHGEFNQTYKSHITNKTQCPICSGFMKNCDEFIIDAIKIHGDKYDYSKINYINTRTKISIICKIHGIFNQSPSSHIHSEKGCPKCSQSHGERKIEKILQKNNINYKSQKQFEGCTHKRPLRFDFYLPDYNLCIEFDGKQHFKSIEFFGGDIRFKEQLKYDEIKNKYCEKNNINLIRIPYLNFKSIDSILYNHIFNISSIV